MLIDHKERTIKINSMDEMMSKDSPLEINYLNQTGNVFYLNVELDDTTDCDMPSIEIKLKRMEPAYHYLMRYDIHDYKIILEEDDITSMAKIMTEGLIDQAKSLKMFEDEK
jgi:hypothetical protein